VEASAGDARVSTDGRGDAPTTMDGGGRRSRDHGRCDASVEDAAVDAVEASALPPSITVTVDTTSLVPPADGGVLTTLIVPASYGPKPVVTVTVVSNSGDMRADDVSSVIGVAERSHGRPGGVGEAGQVRDGFGSRVEHRAFHLSPTFPSICRRWPRAPTIWW
jgi:hypothetical protein